MSAEVSSAAADALVAAEVEAAVALSLEPPQPTRARALEPASVAHRVTKLLLVSMGAFLPFGGDHFSTIK